MGQSISILEFIIITAVCLFGSVLIKTIIQTIQNKSK